MGMAASQARYLGLVARQNNIEYQGQQINQERTILSQQATALYNSLLDMVVPTPPSTSDYTKVVYSGVDGATNFTLGNVKPGEDSTYIVEVNTTFTGNTFEKSNSLQNVRNYGENRTRKGHILTDDDKGDNKTYSMEKLAKIYVNIPASEPNQETDENGHALYSYSISTAYTYIEDGYYDTNGNKYTGQATADPETDTITDNNITYKHKSAGYYDKDNQPFTGDISKLVKQSDNKTYLLTQAGECYIVQDGNTKKYYDTTTNEEIVGLTDKNVTAKYEKVENSNNCLSLLEADREGNKYWKKDAKTNTFTIMPQYDYLYVDASGETEWTLSDKSKETNTTVGGYQLYSFKDAEALFTDDTIYKWKGYEQAILNTNIVDSSGSKVTKDNFFVYIDTSSGNPVPRFVLDSDLNSITGEVTYTEIYNFQSNGNVQKTEAKEGCTLSFDSQGRITQIGIPQYDKDGTQTGITIVPLTASTTTDNVAYEDAYNQYEYQQYLYDKKQQEINAKTKIIQQEDRSLELKLQRLDNERTMVKTELEAVKKVISENIEGSFKVFNG